jgi:hypothetical protein
MPSHAALVRLIINEHERDGKPVPDEATLAVLATARLSEELGRQEG